MERDIQNEEMLDQNQQEILLGQEEVSIQNFLEEMLGVVIDTDNVSKCSLDREEFEKGLKSSSYYAGFISGLSNVGVPMQQIVDLLIILKNNEMQYKVAKDTKLKMEGNEI